MVFTILLKIHFLPVSPNHGPNKTVNRHHHHNTERCQQCAFSITRLLHSYLLFVDNMWISNYSFRLSLHRLDKTTTNLLQFLKLI